MRPLSSPTGFLLPRSSVGQSWILWRVVLLSGSDAVGRCSECRECPVRCVVTNHGVGSWGKKAANLEEGERF